ncbi:MAG: hypothetical protein NPIRA02_41800 [Nitrospirales bacterium]|nr:MAG: hypothetical protein NPIRA02_41800 [Nitrospirales bacterium]
MKSKGRNVIFDGDKETCDYLARMNLFRLIDFDYRENFNRHTEAGRFLPITTIYDEQSVYMASNKICDLALHQFDNAQEFLPAMEWCINEVIDNVRVHAETGVPGTVCAQYYPQRKLLDVAIVDRGRGIKDSLGERISLKNNEEAISRAFERGVTRNPEIGQGNGLAGTQEIVRLNKGELQLWTGDTSYWLTSDRENFALIPEYQGTGVFMRLDTCRPIDLSDIFIARPGWSFIDAELQRADTEGGFKVRQECVHTGGREPARTFRRKLESLIQNSGEPLILNFEGIASTSSSFLDELLGRLVLTLGDEKFRQFISIVNMTQTIRNMADVVIMQRRRNS